MFAQHCQCSLSVGGSFGGKYEFVFAFENGFPFLRPCFSEDQSGVLSFRQQPDSSGFAKVYAALQ